MNSAQRRSFAHAPRLCGCALAILACVFGPTTDRADAGLFTLVDGNASADFDTASSSNNFQWVVDGQDQLFTQGFWYRVGNNPEQSVTSLPIAGELASNTNFDPGLDTLFVAYVGPGFEISVRYVLHGGSPGSYTSDMAEQIRIDNRQSAPLDFHFFQYVDFDLFDTSSGDSAVFSNANAVRQYEGALRVAETVIAPAPNHREIDFYPNILDKLNDAVATTLSDTPPIGTVVGPGDVTWAFQWDVVIPVGGSFIISKDKLLSGVPEPASVVLWTTGLALGVALRRKR